MLTACVLLDIEPIQMPAFLTDVLTLDINKGKQILPYLAPLFQALSKPRRAKSQREKIQRARTGKSQGALFPLLHFSPSLFLSLVVTSLEPGTGYDLVLNLSCEPSDERVS